jgi:hypothetical protein
MRQSPIALGAAGLLFLAACGRDHRGARGHGWPRRGCSRAVVGAIVGGAAGATGGSVMDEGVDQKIDEATDETPDAAMN